MVFVYGKIHGKGRPRFRRIGNFVSTYTDRTTTEYEKLIAACYKEYIETNPDERTVFMDEAVRLNIKATFEMPKSWHKNKRAEMAGKPHTTKPDGDNLIKVIADALNGIAYTDDKQIAIMRVEKRWGENEGLDFELREITE